MISDDMFKRFKMAFCNDKEIKGTIFTPFDFDIKHYDDGSEISYMQSDGVDTERRYMCEFIVRDFLRETK